MPIKPFSHIRLLNTTPTAHTLYLTKTSLSLMKPHNINTTTAAASYHRTPHVLSRIFPFRLKYLALSQHQRHQFSTRSRQADPGRVRAEFKGPGPKSLIEDEAELSDWVSELRTSSNLRGRVTSDEEESESYGPSRKGRTMAGGRERERDGVSVKRRRGEERGSLSRSDFKGKGWVGDELDNDNERDRFRSERRGGVGMRAEKRRGSFNRFGGDLDNDNERDRFRSERRGGVGMRAEKRRGSFSRRENRFAGDLDNDNEKDRFRSERRGGVGMRAEKGRGSFSRRENQFGGDLDNDDEDDDDDEEEVYGLRRESRGNVGRRDGMRGGRERGFGFKKDAKGAVRGRQGFSDDDGSGGFDDGDKRELLMKGIGDLLSEEVSDDVDEIKEGDADVDNKVRSSFGFKEETRSNVTTTSPGKSGSYLSETRFDQFSISPLSLKSIKDAGYEKMTVVQEASLPIILKGKDVLAKARTGTGKTVAFLLPSIEVVEKSPPVSRDQKLHPILVLVICPTRELATQAAAEADKLLKYHPSIGVQVVIGGTRLALEQKRMQANPCQILVATPGRLKDHLENTAGFATRLMAVKVLVLDEADHLLDMGFRKDIEKIISAVPKQRQTLLFSATVPDEVRQICHIALKRDHEFVNTVQEGSEETHAQVRQMHLVAPLEKQFPLLYVLLKDHVADNVDYKVLVFCTTAMVTRLVADLLGELKLNVREIHSRKPQSYRTRVSDEFRKSKGLILVTSDVSARGVDYPDVTLVIQVGLPADREQYIHRLGRTGRKGKEGQGILLLAPWEEFFLSTVKDLPITKAPVPSVDPDTKKMVERALSRVDMKNKETAYQAWLGYYNSYKQVGKDKYRLVELANEFSRCMGLDNPPAIPKLILGKMGLRNIPGLRSK